MSEKNKYIARRELLNNLNRHQWFQLAVLLGKEYPRELRDKEKLLYSIGKEDCKD